jgi:hypothetical protein
VTEENQHPEETGSASEDGESSAAPAGDAGTQEPAATDDAGREAVESEPSPRPDDGDLAASPAPPAPTAPVPPTATTEPGQRRITRHTTTSTTRTESTTDETVVETIAIAPPVYAAPSGEHPRPVG